MKTKTLSIAAAALALAGCVSDGPKFGKGACDVNPSDPVVGNWGLDLGYDFMPAGSMIATRDADGTAQALVLWRWASPTKMENVKFVGNRFSFDHPWGFKISGFVQGCCLTATAIRKDGLGETAITGRRNPPICPKASTKDAKLGEPIDLLKDGLGGWETMGTNGKNGWIVSEEKGEKVLSNKLGLNKDGKWAGGGLNLKTKRSDFYDFNLEYDVRVPAGSNSGVYLRGRYEIQVLDSYGKPVDCHNMAAYYGRVTPSVAAEKKPGEWQHVDCWFVNRHCTIILNGKVTMDNAPVYGVTGGARNADVGSLGPIVLQGDHFITDVVQKLVYFAGVVATHLDFKFLFLDHRHSDSHKHKLLSLLTNTIT